MSAEGKQNSTSDGLRKRKTFAENSRQDNNDDSENSSSELSSVSGRKKPRQLDDDSQADYEFVEEEASSPSKFTSDAGIQKPMLLFYTREISKRFGREQFLITSLREGVVYFLFLIILYIVTSGHVNTSLLHYTEAMEVLFTKGIFREVLTQDNRQAIKNFDRLNTIEDVLSFLKYALYMTSYEEDEKGVKRQRSRTMKENRILGRLRLRQVRVRNDSCEIDSGFRMMFSGCYGPYTRSNEMKSPFGLENGTAWKYSSHVELGARPYSGEFATYSGGGYYFDFNCNTTEILTTLKELTENIWIDRATRAVFLDFTTYNANVNLFCTTKLIMEFPPSGGVLPTSRFYVQKLLRYHSSYDYVILFYQVIFFVFCVYYLCEELYEINYFRWNYVKCFWNWIDLVLVVLLYVTVWMDVREHVRVMVDFPKLITKIDAFPNFEHLYYRGTFYNALRALAVIVAWLKLIKYLTIFSTMYELQVTIRKAAIDLAYYSVIFITVFIAFASLGHLLFGSSVERFRTFTHSFFTLLGSVAGDFNYREIEDHNFFLSSVFFTGFIIVILFILINMYPAILVDAYAEVHSKLVFEAETNEIQMSIGDLLNKWYIMILHKLKMHTQAENREREMKLSQAKHHYEYLHNLLHRCGYSELDIDIYFQKHGISEDKEISEADIKSFLTGIGSSIIRGPHTAEGMLIHEHQTLYDNMNERVTRLEDAVVLANNKVTIIIIKLDAIHQIQMARMSESDV